MLDNHSLRVYPIHEEGFRVRILEHRLAQTDEKAFLATTPGKQLGTLLSDYYNFLNLVLFFLLIWPTAMLCYRFDRIFKTRSLDAIIRFCEAF